MREAAEYRWDDEPQTRSVEGSVGDACAQLFDALPGGGGGKGMAGGGQKKRKRGGEEQLPAPPPVDAKASLLKATAPDGGGVTVVNDEFVVQSLILGALVD